MPIYDYACSACGRVTEVVHGIYDHGPRYCPECGTEGSMRKALSKPAIVFKGSGWAKVDRRASGRPRTSEASQKAGAASGASGRPGEGGSSNAAGPTSAGGEGSAGGAASAGDAGGATADGSAGGAASAGKRPASDGGGD